MNIFPDRIYAQYRNKPKTVQWLNITREMSEQFVTQFDEISKSYDIDSNKGEQLNVIGRVVVQDRDFIANIPLDVYQCNTVGDNECGDSTVQCSATSIADDAELSDEYFRRILKAKIIKNNSQATIHDTLRAVQFIAPELLIVRLNDNEDMTFSIEFAGVADPITRSLLLNNNLVPRPSGVQFKGFLEIHDYTQCGDTFAQCNSDGDNQCIGLTEV